MLLFPIIITTLNILLDAQFQYITVCYNNISQDRLYLSAVIINRLKKLFFELNINRVRQGKYYFYYHVFVWILMINRKLLLD